MDRNTVIGLVLIMGIVLTWSIFTADQEPGKKNPTQTSQTTETDTSNNAVEPTGDPTLDSLTQVMNVVGNDSLKEAMQKAQLFDQFGLFAKAAAGENKDIVIRTDKMEATIQTKGGMIKTLSLNEYQTYDSTTLYVVGNDPENEFSIDFSTKGDKVRQISSKDLYFEPAFTGNDFKVEEGDSLVLPFRAKVDDKNYLEFAYTFRSGKFDYGYKVNFQGIDVSLLKDRSYYLRWVSQLPVTEKSVEKMRENSGIYYREAGEIEELNPRSTDFESAKESNTAVDWISYKSQFFSHALISDPDYPIQSYELTMSTPVNPKVVKKLTAYMRADIAANDYTFFAGPKDYNVMESYGMGFDRQIALGWGPLKWINAWIIIPSFHFLERAVGNYGLIILLIAIAIKLLVSPLTYKTYISSAKMRVINETPEVKELEEKYKDDSTKLQQEKMSYYRTVGASPFGGCLPMLLQYPILISMFYFFPQSIELRQQSFLWAEDLSTYDSIFDFPGGFSIPFYGDHVSLFTLLMAVSIFVFTWINQKTQGSGMAANNPMMKWFPYIMPFFLLGFLNNYSAGLSYYYFLSNILSISQSVITKAMIDDKKLLEQMHAIKKDRKKSGKKSRMETWMEKQQNKQKQLQNARSSQQKGQAGRREKRKKK